jgi:hypothetical protein
VPIAKKQVTGDVTTFELDTQGLPPMIANQIRLRTTSMVGVYETSSGLEATPVAIAGLDVVVRVCKRAKVREFDFDK